MKNCFVALLLLISTVTYSQEFGDHRTGASLGFTNYIMDTNFISSKSNIGFQIGATSGVAISDSFEVLMEITYNYHRVKLLGRDSEESEPKELDYNLQNFGFSALLHYMFLEVDDFYFGVNAGPIATIGYGYRTKSSNENYTIDPLGIESQYMDFDSWSSKGGSFNAFASFGVTAQYGSVMANLRYNKGITDPYRRTPVYSPFMELKGKDNYWSLTFTYFFWN